LLAQAPEPCLDHHPGIDPYSALKQNICALVGLMGFVSLGAYIYDAPSRKPTVNKNIHENEILYTCICTCTYTCITTLINIKSTK
jgi:hypothetical protein